MASLLVSLAKTLQFKRFEEFISVKCYFPSASARELFETTGTDDDTLIEVFVDSGLVESGIEPLQRDTQFSWSFETDI